MKSMIFNINNKVKYNIKAYKNVLMKVNEKNLENITDDELKGISKKLMKQARGGVPLDELLVEAYALVKETAYRVLGLRPYDVQVIAAAALNDSNVVEMQTGEGKTLVAVMPAYLNALTGRGVHILTYNDYLAYRDALWMGPIYEFLGLTVGYIREGMDILERQKAYSCDITYVTAKEAGFDYLRDFLCIERETLLHRRQLNFAIVDEADSILIDEARIPLVIAGNIDKEYYDVSYLSHLVKSLNPDEDYEVDQLYNNVFLTDKGIVKAEKMLGCKNLYDGENIELLIRLRSAMLAELLEKDKDYIVTDEGIKIIDEFTGRIAEKRHWPEFLHEAVEAKEGILTNSSGIVLNSIALQHFASLYSKLSGMTGTAKKAAYELKELYLLDVVVIPTNKPCIRKDHPDRLFASKEEKNKAVIAEIAKIHESGQPVLVGTGSIAESEKLAVDLISIGIQCQVLNAKNDEMEAETISGAGNVGAVTVSTNMAGRGIDIKLGGGEEKLRDKVAALGGLYVICTNRHETQRIDQQLRGRAGRQGDPGESRFFISLEDDIMVRYGFGGVFAQHCIQIKQNGEITDDKLKCKVESCQKLVEGYNSDVRIQLWKYSFILEQQRRIIYRKREDILLDRIDMNLLIDREPERYAAIKGRFNKNVVISVEKQLALYFINKCWAEYLEYISYIKDGIHLVVIGKKNPLDEYNKTAVEAFDELIKQIDDEVVNAFKFVEIKENGLDLYKEGLIGPSSTWTYFISDNPQQFSKFPVLLKVAEEVAKKPLFRLNSVFKNILRKYCKQ